MAVFAAASQLPDVLHALQILDRLNDSPCSVPPVMNGYPTLEVSARLIEKMRCSTDPFGKSILVSSHCPLEATGHIEFISISEVIFLMESTSSRTLS